MVQNTFYKFAIGCDLLKKTVNFSDSSISLFFTLDDLVGMVGMQALANKTKEQSDGLLAGLLDEQTRIDVYYSQVNVSQLRLSFLL